MPDYAMIQQYGDIAVAFAVYTFNTSKYGRDRIFARHPLLRLAK